MKNSSFNHLLNPPLVSVLRILTVAVLLLVIVTTGFVPGGFNSGPYLSQKNEFTQAKPANSQIADTYARLPLSFVPNVGQVDAGQVEFEAQGRGYNLYLTSDGAVFDLKKGNDNVSAGNALQPYSKSSDLYNPVKPRAEETSTAIGLKLIGASPQPQVEGLQEQAGKNNYFIGTKSSDWHTNVPNYGQVLYKSVYNGIDLLYYGNQQRLEYDFVVAPGGDYENIQLNFSGIDTLSLNTQDDLVMNISGTASQLIQRKPLIYQEINNQRHPVEGKYKLISAEPGIGHNLPLVGFEVANFDPALPLVIDPILDYSTYLGGNGSDSAFGIVVNSAGEAYISGTSSSTNFPNLAVGSTTTHRGQDVFVIKLNAAGTGVIYSSYMGGSANENGQRLAVDSNGNAYLTGDTNSSDFPTVPLNSTSPGGSTDAFISKLGSDGATLVYSSYLGGSGKDEGNQLAVDSAGNAYLTGYTQSAGLATTGAYQTTLKGTQDAYFAKFNSTGATSYFTYLGGTGAGVDNDAGYSLVLDGSNSVYITGVTNSADFPVTTGTFKGSNDAFVIKLTPASSTFNLAYSALLGGNNGGTYSFGIALDSAGNAYITGSTDANDFITLNPLQASYQGGFDVIVSKLNSSGSLVFSTFLGGTSYEQGNAIGVDASGNIYITGQTFSANFPQFNSFQPVLRGSSDGFLTELNPPGNGVIYSTFLGGDGNDASNFLALDSNANVYLAGQTESTNFPTTSPAQPTFGGGPLDSFVARIKPATILVTQTDDFGPASVNTEFTLSYALTHATSSQTIVFQLVGGGNTITIHGQIPAPTNSHVIIDGGPCNTNGIILDGSSTTADGLLVQNNVTVRNVTIKGFNGRRILAEGTAGNGYNQLFCVKAIR